jgi:squalene monooxygenase
VLLYQIGAHETRILVDVPTGLASASVANGGVKGHLRQNVLPNLPKQLRPAFEEALNEGKLRSMPNSWLPPSTNRTPGLILLGDAMNMRHPLTGGGMTVALNDVVLLRTLLAPETVPDLQNSKIVQLQMKTFHWQRKHLTSVINILAQALYQLFAANGKFIPAKGVPAF